VIKIKHTRRRRLKAADAASSKYVYGDCG